MSNEPKTIAVRPDRDCRKGCFGTGYAGGLVVMKDGKPTSERRGVLCRCVLRRRDEMLASPPPAQSQANAVAVDPDAED